MMHGEKHRRLLYGKACEQLLLPLIERLFGPVRKGSVEDDYSGVDVYVWGIPMQIKVRYCKTSNITVHIREREYNLIKSGEHRAKHFLCFFIHGNKLYLSIIHIDKLLDSLEKTEYGYYIYQPTHFDKVWECDTWILEFLYTMSMLGMEEDKLMMSVEYLIPKFLQSLRELPCE